LAPRKLNSATAERPGYAQAHLQSRLKRHAKAQIVAAKGADGFAGRQDALDDDGFF
jgi:hypothetical protein